MVGATFVPAYQSWTYDLGIDGYPIEGSDPAFFEGYGKLPDFYEAPWNRFQPYLVGILLGYCLHQARGKDIKINFWLNIFAWQAAFLSAFAVVYGTDSERGDDVTRLSRTENMFYNGFHRIAWTVSLSWVIFSCSKGYGGIINDFLSWSFFLPLSRLSFMTYLVHATVIFLSSSMFSTFGVSLHWTVLTGLFFGNLMISMGCALLLMLVVEAPFIKLEKLVISKLMGSQRGKKPV